ncbi:MAG: alkaline phosphatase family protein [Maricaulis sp.]|uniref:nucleotide pyrophosphatase/phosphodiesterase family protein n=1 Tax=Maricaulis sp. TaxID=1486257 RepID=UPI002628DD5D|nr:nucleotide pyrophosphatase/phosphodiesterase family protein [Maricaulis sp.]MDM7983297.1 alkaline phosphatase family protein [Maricaulis sp.]
MSVRTLATPLILGVTSMLAGCASLETPVAEAPAEDPIVLMIGLDGLRYDAIDRHAAPNLSALAARGTRPQSMYPVMPSKTFVNFYSIATGLYPENHGMLSNAPYDREADIMFSNRNGDAQNPFWWSGEPIWQTAENQGLRAHVMFWLGSEVEGQRPTVWHPYEHNKPYKDRVEEVLAWFDAPADGQPDFAAVYFDHVDSVIHRSGPFTEEEGEAVARVDSLVGALVDGLEARGLLERTNIFIVSDHGMAPTSTDRVIMLDELADLSGLYMPDFLGPFGAGLEPYAHTYGDEAVVKRVYNALNGAHEHLSVYRRQDVPAHYHIDHPTRGPDLFIVGDPGWHVSLSSANLDNPYLAGLQGNHGFDNYSEEMGATFIGAGPIFPAGARPDSFENVNVYGLIACALGIEPAATDGDPAEVARISGGRCPAE